MRKFQQAKKNGFNENELCPFCDGKPHECTICTNDVEGLKELVYRCSNCGAMSGSSVISWEHAWKNWIMRKKLPEKFIVVTNMDDHEHASFETVEKFDRKERAISFFENINSRNCVEKTLYRATVISSSKKH